MREARSHRCRGSGRRREPANASPPLPSRPPRPRSLAAGTVPTSGPQKHRPAPSVFPEVSSPPAGSWVVGGPALDEAHTPRPTCCPQTAHCPRPHAHSPLGGLPSGERRAPSDPRTHPHICRHLRLTVQRPGMTQQAPTVTKLHSAAPSQARAAPHPRWSGLSLPAPLHLAYETLSPLARPCCRQPPPQLGLLLSPSRRESGKPGPAPRLPQHYPGPAAPAHGLPAPSRPPPAHLGSPRDSTTDRGPRPSVCPSLWQSHTPCRVRCPLGGHCGRPAPGAPGREQPPP